MHRIFRLAPVVLALFAMIGTQLLGQTQTTRQQSALLTSAREVSSAFEGTWILQQRTTPSGRPHRQPLKGEFTVKLSVDSTAVSKLSPTGVGTLAGGSYSGIETGLMDGGFSDFNPGADVINPNPNAAAPGPAAAPATIPGLARAAFPAAAAQPPTKDVLFEMRGSSGLALEMNIKDPNTVDLVFRDLELKGTYGVFRQGVRGARVPTTFQKTTRRFLFFRTGISLNLKNTFGSANLNIPRDARGPGLPSDKSHDIVKHIVNGDRMEITYGNGGRDVWVRRR